MPLYEYECKKCKHRFERIQKFSDRLVRKCPQCRDGKVVKLLSPPAVHFKGTGWYVTDYARKGRPSEAGGLGEGAGKEGAGKEGAGKEGAGKEGTGKEGAGKEGTGKDRAGKESSGEKAASKESTGKSDPAKKGSQKD